MLRPTRILLRDGESRALLRAVDLRGHAVRIEGTSSSALPPGTSVRDSSVSAASAASGGRSSPSVRVSTP